MNPLSLFILGGVVYFLYNSNQPKMVIISNDGKPQTVPISPTVQTATVPVITDKLDEINPTTGLARRYIDSEIYGVHDKTTSHKSVDRWIPAPKRYAWQ